MKNLLKITMILACIFSLGAAAAPVKPSKCPSASALRSGRFVTAEYDDEFSAYGAAQNPSRYGTSQTWGFAVLNIKADSPEQAKKKAQAALPTLVGEPEPIFSAQDNMWMCLYSIGGGYIAGAVAL